jgi:predicted MFS family arabinose efflux permease
MAKAFWNYPKALTIGLIFLFLNFAFGSWLSRLPEVQTRLEMSEATLGLVLLSMPLGSMISTTISRQLLARYEAGRLAIIMILLFTALMIFPPLAPTPFLLSILLFLVGLTHGLLNVSMNTTANAVEDRLKTKVVSSIHGMFSLGGFFGALIGGTFAKIGIPLVWQMAFIFSLAVIILSWKSSPIWQFEATISKERQPMRWPSKKLMIYMIIGVCIMVGEGAISDWSTIYLAKNLQAGPLIAALGFAGFSAAMATGRFSGDRIRSLIIPKVLVRNGALLSFTGLLLAIFSPIPGIAILGFTLAGLGYATGVPILFLEAGRLTPKNPGIGIAAVANAGIIGFLGAPPAIGLIAEHYELNKALLLVAVLALTAAILSHLSFED